jgi:uncharacterized protein (DUF1786 family)
MKILAIDIGTGTQDIFLYDSTLDLENGYKLVVPSPTMIVHHRLREATRRAQPVLLTGVTMGGGPSQWAAEAHLRAGLQVYATPEAARSFNDDLDVVSQMGIRILSQDEAQRLPALVLRVELRDFNFQAILRALEPFDVRLDDLAAVAVAVCDHGNAPPGVSDRQFRFDYLELRIRSRPRPGASSPLSAFAYLSNDVPSIMTRLQAVVDSAQDVDAPLMVMDTAPAAVLGATFDPRVAARQRVLVANVGNFHTLAFRLGQDAHGFSKIEGMFEHHTGLLDLPRLESLLLALADGSLKHSDVFDDHGHGALLYEQDRLPLGTGDFDVAVTGPRRNIFRKPGRLSAYFAVPFGDMMISGCFGLLAALADLMPEIAVPIRTSLRGEGGSGSAPWDNDG